MGLHHTSDGVFYGFFVTTATYRLALRDLYRKGFADDKRLDICELTDLTTRVALSAHIIKLGNIDPMLEPQDMNRGHIRPQDVRPILLRVLHDDKVALDRFLIVTNEEQLLLRDCRSIFADVSDATKDNDDRSRVCWWFYELDYSTLDGFHIDSVKRLPISNFV